MNRDLFISSRYKAKNKRLRYLFVILGLAMVFTLAIYPIIQNNELFTPISMPKINKSFPNQFKINNAEFKGYDTKNKPFKISAKTAYQSYKDENNIRIEDIKGFFYQEGIKNDIVASHGAYLLDKNEIILTKNVSIISSNGNSVKTNELVIKTKSNFNLNPVEMK